MAVNSFATEYKIGSPDGKIMAVVEDGTQLTFSLNVDGRKVLDKHPIKFKTEKREFGQNASVQSYEYCYADSVKKKVIDFRKWLLNNG
jgi:hypothetical protein